MMLVVTTFANFLPYVFIICVVGIVEDKILSAFRGGRL